MPTTCPSRQNCEQKCGGRRAGPWPPGALPPGWRTGGAERAAPGYFLLPPPAPPPPDFLASASLSS
eukprot:2114988-Pyramimonas_sp.AAC.1